MDARGFIYEMTDAQREALMGDGFEDKKIDGKRLDTLEKDAARLEGYLKGRADSDAPHIRANSDLTRRSSG